MNKYCKDCCLEKPVTEFNKDVYTRDRLMLRCKSCMSEYKKKMRSTDEQKEKARLYRLRTHYNLTGDEYYNLIAGGCDACGSKVGIAVDHDHSCCPGKKTCGKCIRGVLCRRCNTAEGMFKADPKMIYSLIKYMEKHNVI